MKTIRIIGVLVFLLLMVGSASACNSGYCNNNYYSLDLVKSANPATYDHVGQVIEYTYTVTNKGSAITGTITITDNKIPGMIISINDDLARNAQVTRKANYVVTQDDLNKGYVINTATATTTVKIGQNSCTI
ncbi:MAG: DUF7507 domain-containing protein [Methanosarcina sp.]|jgi:uncharacterized repeat protein (TIGR01451 family)